MATYKDGTFEYELPAFDMELVKLADVYLEKESSYDIFKAQYDFVAACLPEEYLINVFGTDDFEKCDTTIITVVYTKIKLAYEQSASKMLDSKDVAKAVSESRQRFANRK